VSAPALARRTKGGLRAADVPGRRRAGVGAIPVMCAVGCGHVPILSRWAGTAARAVLYRPSPAFADHLRLRPLFGGDDDTTGHGWLRSDEFGMGDDALPHRGKAVSQFGILVRRQVHVIDQ
jgi:hypothetical protein